MNSLVLFFVVAIIAQYAEATNGTSNSTYELEKYFNGTGLTEAQLVQLVGILSEPSPETAFLGFLASISNATVRNAVLAKAQALEAVEPEVQSLAQQIYNLYAANLNATSKKTLNATLNKVNAGTATFSDLYTLGSQLIPVSKFNSTNNNVFAQVVTFLNANPGFGTLLTYGLSVTCS